MRIHFNNYGVIIYGVLSRYIHVVHRSSETLKFGPNSQFGDFHSKRDDSMSIGESR